MVAVRKIRCTVKIKTTVIIISIVFLLHTHQWIQVFLLSTGVLSHNQNPTTSTSVSSPPSLTGVMCDGFQVIYLNTLFMCSERILVGF